MFYLSVSYHEYSLVSGRAFYLASIGSNLPLSLSLSVFYILILFTAKYIETVKADFIHALS